MKILYTNAHSHNGGGHTTYIASLARAFQGEHQITVAAPVTSRLYQQAQQIPGVQVWNTSFSTRVKPMLLEVLALRVLLQEERFDLVHVNGSSDHRQLMLARRGLSHSPRIVWTKHNTMPVGSLGNQMRAWAGTDGAIGVCDYVARQLMDSGYRARPVQMIRLGVDTGRFCPPSDKARAQARRELLGELPDGVCVLGSVGGTDRAKGWLTLVQALARLPISQRGRFRVLVAGDPLRGALKQEMDALRMGPYVVFPGLVEDPRRILAASDVGFVLSSQEAGSYAVCESLAMGLPTLVSSAGGLPELVRDGVDGWVVPVGDVDALRRWLLARLAGPLDGAMAASARGRAQALFSLSECARQTMDFYRRVGARSGSASI
ncbi:MAG: glycosyltransferase family 4 protein [Castellaniella sp.]|uniref:glycosyltransferase family 4 protein n=1 Tax=Castellaniella sp. TaxID=1955812 RepID=UPI003C75939A